MQVHRVWGRGCECGALEEWLALFTTQPEHEYEEGSLSLGL